MPPASILVAEDQTDIRDLLVMNLRSAGYDVSAVADGPAALASQSERASDLLVLDLMMPGLDGLEVTKALRARGRSTPILMLTAKSTASSASSWAPTTTSPSRSRSPSCSRG